MLKTTNFKRAIFLSWYCSVGDCTFCFMSTQKGLISDPKKAKRRFESIFAEAIITKACGWDIEFLSGGYNSYTKDELLFIIKTVSQIIGKKVWLNLGVLTEKNLSLFLPYTEGYIGTVECVNPVIHDKVCPSKSVKPIINTFKLCDKHGIKKGMTMIVGIGEALDDFSYLADFIKENNIERITFYALNPQKGTVFTKSPELGYYTEWIRMTRKEFPKIEIIAGAWRDKTNYFSKMLLAGADSFTKFPAIKYFGKKEAKEVEKEVNDAGREFIGTFTKLPYIDADAEVEKLDIPNELKKKTKAKVLDYLMRMQRNNQ